MLVIYQLFLATFMVSASITMCGEIGVTERTNAVTSKNISAFERHWRGNTDLK